MTSSPKTYETALERLQEYIKANNMRRSVVREMILEQVCLLPQPFTADQLSKACAAERISVGSVYNVLEVFVLAQILHAIKRQRGRTAMEYELTMVTRNRIQVICGRCHRVTSFHDKAIEHLIQIRKYSNFNPSHYTLFVYGECKHCRNLLLTDKKENK
jgi:Fur family ferric uptake transcriptional regulator